MRERGRCGRPAAGRRRTTRAARRSRRRPRRCGCRRAASPWRSTPRGRDRRAGSSASAGHRPGDAGSHPRTPARRASRGPVAGASRRRCRADGGSRGPPSRATSRPRRAARQARRQAGDRNDGAATPTLDARHTVKAGLEHDIYVIARGIGPPRVAVPHHGDYARRRWRLRPISPGRTGGASCRSC